MTDDGMNRHRYIPDPHLSESRGPSLAAALTAVVAVMGMMAVSRKKKHAAD